MGNFVKNAANKVKEGIQHVAGKVKGAFQKVGNFVKNAANKVKEGIQHVAGKVKEGFQKAGKWIKDNAGKVAKFGLKIWSTATSLVGRVAGFIPGVGKLVGKAIGGISKAADIVAEKIPVDLGDKLNKGMKVMSAIQNPFGEYPPSITQRLSFNFWNYSDFTLCCSSTYLGTVLKGTAGKIADILLKRD